MCSDLFLEHFKFGGGGGGGGGRGEGETSSDLFLEHFKFGVCFLLHIDVVLYGSLHQPTP